MDRCHMLFRGVRGQQLAKARGLCLGGTLACGLLAFALIFTVAEPGHAAELASFAAGNGGWHMGTLAIGNLDDDPFPEIVVPYRDLGGQWFLDAFHTDGTRVTGFPYAGGGKEINTSPTLYDLDGDGREEIIFTHGDQVIMLRGNGTPWWSSTVNYANYVPDGGYMAVTNGFYWSNGGGFISRLPSTAVFSSQVSSPMVADMNGDGRKEVVTAWKIDPDSTSGHQDFNPFINDLWGSGEWGTMGETWSGGVVFFDAFTGFRNYAYHFHQLVESGLALGQADADEAKEVYVLNDSDSVVCFDKTQPPGLYGKGMLHGQFGKNQRFLSGAYQIGVDIYTADLDGDGRAEVLVPSTRINPLWQPHETILDDDGAVLWRTWKQPVTIPVNQWQNNAGLIPLNPDRDNHIDVLGFTHSHEISFRSWNGVELADRPGWPKDFSPYLPTPPVVGDVDGDGQEEIVIGTFHPAQPAADGTLYVFGLDGALKAAVPVPGGLKHIPTLADMNGDGGVEVVYRSLAGRIYFQNFGATHPGPVSWATHRGNARRDGNLGVSLFPPGTPLLTRKESGYRRASFSWSGPDTVKAWRIYRADHPAGPFVPLVTLTPETTSYTDYSLKPGCQYVYEVAAVLGSGTVRSAPIAILSGLNGNCVANSGFEENDNSHWDKWFTGDLGWNSMTTTTNGPLEGRTAMEITLRDNGGNGTISQYGQYGTPDAHLPVTPGQLYSFGGFFQSRGLSQPSEHWIEWHSTITAGDTNRRPTRPWPLYFTPPFNIGTNATAWTYANRTFVLPEGFSNVEISHRYTIAAPGSGTLALDNLFFRALPAPASTNWTTLIPFGATWRYAEDEPSSGWSAPSFHDLGWRTGTAKLGAGSGPQNLVTRLAPQRPAYYFRHTFLAPAVPWEDLLLSATCTGGGGKSLEIYLNGVPLVTTGIDAVSGQGNEVHYYDLTPFLGLLRPGSNTIAVMLNNTWEPAWDDVAFDLRLQAMSYAPVETGFHGVQPKAGLPAELSGVDLGVSVPMNSIWRVESADSLTAPQWQLMEVVTNRSSLPFWLRDVGQGGRLAPAQTPSRFYRLTPE